MTRELVDLARRTGVPILHAPQGTPSNLAAVVLVWPTFQVERRSFVRTVLRVRSLSSRRVAVDLVRDGTVHTLATGTAAEVAAALPTVRLP